jgi:hypothetical protein
MPRQVAEPVSKPPLVDDQVADELLVRAQLLDRADDQSTIVGSPHPSGGSSASGGCIAVASCRVVYGRPVDESVGVAYEM